MISIAVLVFDKDYAAGLERYLSAGTLGDYLFGVYSDPEGFDRFVKERCADVIVAEEGCLDIEPEVPCVKLIRKRTALRDEGIGMYRSLDLVAEDIRDAAARFGHDFRQKEGDALKPEDHVSEGTGAGHENYPCERITDETAKRVANAGSAQITGVCSPLGGVYSSTFAFALAAYHSKGARTLFVSFDPFFDPVSDDGIRVNGGLGRLIYLLDRESDRAVGKCAHRVGGLDCIFGADHWTDICDMTGELAWKLIDQIEKEGYKIVIMDIRLFGAASIPLLRSATRIMVPCPRGGRVMRNKQTWEDQLLSVGIEKERISYTEVPYDELIHEGSDYGSLLKGRLGRFVEETEGKRYVR